MKISLKNLPLLYDAIAKENDLFLPIFKAGEVNFAKYEKGAMVDLDKLKTTKSAKDVFFPQTQDLVRFEVNGKVSCGRGLLNARLEPQVPSKTESEGNLV